MHDPFDCVQTLPFELYGDWWKEGLEHDKYVSGCLSYDPDHGLQLQLYDDLPGESLASIMGDDHQRPIWGTVHGFAGRRVKVSLLDVIRTNRPNNPRAAERPSAHTIFFINRAILGAHTSNLNALKLVSAHFSLSDLESFVGTKPVVPLRLGDDITVNYTPADRAEETVREADMKVKIRTLMRSSASLLERNCTVSYRDEIKLTPATAIPLEKCTDIIFSLRVPNKTVQGFDIRLA